MQNKGAIRAIAIIFALIFLYQLSFTVVTKIVERRAEKNAIEQVFPKDANGQDIAVSESIQDAIAETMQKRSMDESQAKNYLKEKLENSYLDSMNTVNVYNLGFKKYTYRDAKEKEINLGLDLKGGMNVTLEVSVKDIVKALSHDSQDPVFLQAMELASKRQQESKGDFVTLFGEAFKETDPNAKLVSIFLLEFKDKKDININSSNDDVLKVLKEESDAAIDRSYQILGTRIDRFGVAQPNIQKLENSGRILVELPGIKDPERVRKLLQGTAQLEFWETYNFSEIQQAFIDADAKLAANRKNKSNDEETPAVSNDSIATEEVAAVAEEGENEEATEADSTDVALLDQLNENQGEEEQIDEELDANHPLFSKLQPVNGSSARVGIAMVKDTAAINQMLAETKSLFPRQLKLAWTVKPENISGENGESIEVLDLVALKMSRDNTCALGGEVITDARQDYGQGNQVEVTIQMNPEGANKWKNLTRDNVGKQIAIVLDDLVYSYPVVNGEIPNGRSSISGGGMTIEEAQDLANILKAGKLPAPARILEEQVVGPTLGKESVQKGMWSMVFAFILVLVYMVFF
ncbi:MAG: protein translocase subunit SecDF, partial [Bacteroidales bacterium]|nr:protein translocase subunit SecDF [Bacteroidales bacterium]